MGWFKNTEHHTVTANIFVPTWGWDGSILKKQLKLSKGDFRPHLGMGWFLMDLPDVEDLKIFVPAWGWVGLL